MAEGVQAALGILGRLGGRGKHHAGRADGRRHRTRLQDAHADGARALVARAGYHGRSGGEAGEPRRAFADARAHFRRFIHLGEPAFGNARGFGHFLRPAAVGHVEQQRSRGLLHVDGELAGEPVAHVVLGAHDVADLREDLRLMRLDPQQLGEGEVGQRGIAGELDQALVADLLGQPVAFGLGAGVAPDERGAQDLAVFIEHDRAVHLAGEANRRDGLARFRSVGERFANGILGGAPPVLGILFGPAGVRGAEGRMRARGSADEFP